MTAPDPKIQLAQADKKLCTMMATVAMDNYRTGMVDGATLVVEAMQSVGVVSLEFGAALIDRVRKAATEPIVLPEGGAV